MVATVFYSFHYTRDAARVQLIQNIGALEGQPLLNHQAWEEVKRKGDGAIQRWIDKEMSYKRTVVVLMGQETASRPWVHYEIVKAWNERKTLLGVRIHGISSFGATDRPGDDPFVAAGVPSGYVPVFDPTVKSSWMGPIDSKATHEKLKTNLVDWVAQGYRRP